MAKIDHYQKMTAALESADQWMDADWGWKGDLSNEERLAYRMADLAEAQVHATAAQVIAISQSSTAI